MKQSAVLVVASVLSVLFLTFHLADDIVRGFEKGNLANLTALPICVLWLYGALVLAERRSGYVIVFLLSILGVGIPFLHMRGKGVGVHDFFFVWTLLAMGVTSLLSVVLSARALWVSRKV